MARNLKKKMLVWVQDQVRLYRGLKVKNLHRSWSNGLAFCALVHSFDPTRFDFYALDKKEIEKNLQFAFDSAEELGICKLLDVDDITDFDRPDDVIIVTYLTGFLAYYKKNKSLILKKRAQKVDWSKEKESLVQSQVKKPPIPKRTYKRRPLK